MRTSLALVHHGNQYLITTGYDNREGIEAIVGSEASQSGFRYILHLHERTGIPLQSASEWNADRSDRMA